MATTALDSHEVAGAVRFEVTLAVARAVAAATSFILLLAQRPVDVLGNQAGVAGQVGLHVALAVASLCLVPVARRLRTRTALDRLGVAVTSFDLAFFLVYAVTYHGERGRGTLISLFVLVEAANPALAALDRKSTRLNSSHVSQSRMPSSA